MTRKADRSMQFTLRVSVAPDFFSSAINIDLEKSDVCYHRLTEVYSDTS